MHLRQIALVARELEPVVDDLCEVFGLEVGFRDPGVGEFGLHNAVMPVGTQFLEVVSPLKDGTTAGRFLERQGGDGGYMVILQTDDLDTDRRRMEALGVRIVWQVTLDDIATVHLHPRDIGGAIVSLDQPRPPESWRWGGADWQARARTHVVRAFTNVTLAAPDPAGLAARWAEILGLAPPRRAGTALELALDPGVIRFVGSADGASRVAATGIAAADPDRALAIAAERGLRTADTSLWVGGMRFDLE